MNSRQTAFAYLDAAQKITDAIRATQMDNIERAKKCARTASLKAGWRTCLARDIRGFRLRKCSPVTAASPAFTRSLTSR